VITRKRVLLFSAIVVILVVLTIVIFEISRNSSTIVASTKPGIFTDVDMSLQDEQLHQQLFIGMGVEQIKSSYPDLKKMATQLTYSYNHSKTKVEALVVEKDGKQFSTPRGIRIGDSQKKVLEHYGPYTFQVNGHFCYVFRKEGAELQLIKNSQELADEKNTSSLYEIIIGFTLKNPTVNQIGISPYENGQKDPVAGGIISIRKSAETIPEDIDSVFYLYDQYLEASNVAHMQFANYQISYEEYRRLDEISLQVFRNYIDGLKRVNEVAFKAGFKADIISIAEEGYQLIDDRSKTKRDSDAKENAKITSQLISHRKKLESLARTYDSAVSSNSHIYIQRHLQY
jgi:hypothetical protein